MNQIAIDSGAAPALSTASKADLVAKKRRAAQDSGFGMPPELRDRLF
ncbi:MAG: hypothetical protein H7293_19735 [Candidatus Saccharibacteria bacterium]|nr:hypothetical protein [Rhodoferax sp.]